MADFMSREFFKSARPPPARALPGARKAVASPRRGGNGKGVNLFPGI